jgi:N-acetylglucosaminyldiphosphoundecaprenol N-acetyl-beta-D-mannosaminyltransferase
MPTDRTTAVQAGDVGYAPDPRIAFFGTHITPRTFSEWLAGISDVLDGGQRGWLSGCHNLHSLCLLQRNNDVRRFYARCNDCYIDGVSVRLILSGFKVYTNAQQRFSLMDHFLDLLQHAEKNDWSVFYLGSRESVVTLGRGLVREMFPDLRIQFQHGYCSDDPALVQTINELRPDILLVGMGMPLQERWLVEHLNQLDVGFIAQAGSTLDYYTGAQAKPPPWVSRNGFAWLYRLLTDPVRLWQRYLIEPWVLLFPTLRQWYRYRKFR